MYIVFVCNVLYLRRKKRTSDREYSVQYISEYCIRYEVDLGGLEEMK
jgi:hypothetical protein